MHYHIDPFFLSLPPYLSTPWHQVQMLRKEENHLAIELVNGKVVKIPDLDGSTLKELFEMHEKILKNPPSAWPISKPRTEADSNLIQPFSSLDSLSSTLLHSFDKFFSFFQHDIKLANSPDLPADLVQQLQQIAQGLTSEEKEKLPQKEPHCNCPGCQIMQLFHQENGSNFTSEKKEDQKEEEIVADTDLTFSEWKIDLITKNLYKVSNPNNPNESYQVFLGSPIGCTCGKTRCAHIEAVLKT